MLADDERAGHLQASPLLAPRYYDIGARLVEVHASLPGAR